MGIICLIGIGRNWNPGSRNLVDSAQFGHHRLLSVALQNKSALRVLNIAKAEIGVRELTGNNDGIKVERYLAYVGFKKGNPWCAAFVSWVFSQAGYHKPITAWSPALFPISKRTPIANPAAIFGIYFPEYGRIAHCGLIEKQEGDWLVTIEGNTNLNGSREGDGVYRKRRHLRTIKYFADWIGKGKENKP